MSKKSNKNINGMKNNSPVFENNTITNFVYPKNDKSNPKLKDIDVILSKEWVDENHK